MGGVSGSGGCSMYVFPWDLKSQNEDQLALLIKSVGSFGAWSQNTEGSSPPESQKFTSFLSELILMQGKDEDHQL